MSRMNFVVLSYILCFFGNQPQSKASSPRNQFRDYTLIPVMGKYKSGDVLTNAIFLGKSNLKILDIDDSEDGDDVLRNVYERRVAKEVVPILLRQNIQDAMYSSLRLLKQSPNMAVGRTNSVLTTRDGGLLDDMRFVLSQGVELGDPHKRLAIIGRSPVSSSASAADSSAITIMRVLKKMMDEKGSGNEYVDFTLAIENLLGLCIQGLLIEVLDRPSSGSLALGGAVLIGDVGEGQLSLCSETALETIRENQRGRSKSIFLKCHSDEVVGLHIASRHLASRSVQNSSYQYQYQRLLKSESIPIVVSNEISESLGIDVLMKKYKHSTKLMKEDDGSIIVKRYIDSNVENDIQVSGPLKSKKIESAQMKSSKVTDSQGKNFQKGDKVEARLKGGSAWFPAKVLAVRRDDFYDIIYDDGQEIEENIPSKFVKSIGDSTIGTANPDLLDASVFLSMKVSERRDWLRRQGIGSLMPRPREGLRAVNAACFNVMDVDVVYEVLRRLAECDGNEEEASKLVDFESKKPKIAKAILIAQENGDIENVQKLNMKLQSMGRLMYHPFKPFLNLEFDVEEWYYNEVRSRTGQRKIG